MTTNVELCLGGNHEQGGKGELKDYTFSNPNVPCTVGAI
jgi:hypothetical protein